MLTEAGLTEGAEGVRFFRDPATSSKIPALDRAGFTELAAYARPGDTLTVSELYRLCRDLHDILAVRAWCQQHGVKLRALSGLLSTITDLAATDATTTMLVNVLVSLGQFQRDLQNELTREGLAAAWANGATSGRRPKIAQLGLVDDVRQRFRAGASLAALSRQHRVSRGAIRTAVADLLPDQPEHPIAAAAEPVAVVVEMPGTIARRLIEHADLGDAERQALQQARTVRRGQGHSLHVTALPGIHQALLAAAAVLNADGASPAERKAHRIYAARLNKLADGQGTPREAPQPPALAVVDARTRSWPGCARSLPGFGRPASQFPARSSTCANAWLPSARPCGSRGARPAGTNQSRPGNAGSSARSWPSPGSSLTRKRASTLWQSTR